MRDLDDAEAPRTMDPGRMGLCLDAFSDQCRQAIEIGRGAPRLALEGISRVVVCGMGGSGMAGRLAERFARLPISACRDEDLPAWVGRETLVLVVSYSGNTKETLSSLRQALDRRAPVFALGSGGALKEESARTGFPFVEVPSGLQPRAALGYLALPCLVALSAAGAVQSLGPWEALLAAIDAVRSRCAPRVAGAANPAKTLAFSLHGHVPLIYGTTGNTDVVAERWKTQINENAKQAAFWNALPELGHNEIVALARPDFLRNHVAVLLRNELESPTNLARLEATRELLAESAVPFHEIRADGDTPLAQVFSQIHLGDYVSYYLALLSQVDPTPVDLIARFKRRSDELSRAPG